MGNVVISVDGLYQAVHDMVEHNFDDNMDRFSDNITEAAEHARDELADSSGHMAGGGSFRGPGSISGGRMTSSDFYSSGWMVYGRSKSRKVYTRVVANKHAPKLTHLLEFGHGLVYYGRPTGRRVPGDHAIRRAYENAAPIVRGGL